MGLSGEEASKDYFIAHLEEGGLVVEPYCACGQKLGEKYYCETCKRQCICLEIRCEDEETLQHVRSRVMKHPGFHRFSAVLLPKNEKRK